MGQQSIPTPSLVTPLFSNSSVFRQDFCKESYRDNSSGDFSLAKGLSGKSLNVWMLNGRYLNLEKDGSIDKKNPGLIVLMMDEVARRGDFTWRDSFAIDEFNPIKEGRDFSDLLSWTTNTFDISGISWIHTPQRASMGASFSTGWYDASLLLVGPKSKKKSKFKLLAFGTPFTYSVWALLIFTLVATGIVLACVENGSKTWEGGYKGLRNLRFSDNMYESFMASTGHISLKLDRSSTCLVTFSLAFFTIIMLAAYTANLASFLVMNRTPLTVIQDINDIIKKEKSMCIFDASASEERIRRKFPSAILVEKETNENVIEGLNNGDCDYAITQVSFWREAKVKTRFNRLCNLTQIGDIIGPAEAGFATISDAGNKCTSFIRDILDVHFKAMVEDNFVEDAWARQVEGAREVTCSAEEEIGKLDEGQKLNLDNTGGIFIFHFTLVAFALAWSICKRSRNNDKITHDVVDMQSPKNSEVEMQQQHSLRSFGQPHHILTPSLYG